MTHENQLKHIRLLVGQMTPVVVKVWVVELTGVGSVTNALCEKTIKEMDIQNLTSLPWIIELIFVFHFIP